MTIRKRLSDGSLAQYSYHRASKTRLIGEYGSPEFLSAYLEAERSAAHSTETVVSLIREYLLSPKFDTKLAPRTQAEYRRMLAHLEERFGDLPVKALESPKVRGVFIDYQEQIGRETPREADNRMSVLSAVFSYAFDKGRITRNPIGAFTRLHRADRSDILWTEADIARFMRDAPVELQRVMILALHTGQRYGDLLHLRWSDYTDGRLRLIQSKSSARVEVPCTPALGRMLDGSPKTCDYILTRSDGGPWFTTKDDKYLAKAWRAHMEAAGIYHKPWEVMTDKEKRAQLHFNDIRGTSITLLAEAGATIPQIVSITGHTLRSATRILERYMSRTSAMSRAAMDAFEHATATRFANQLQTRRAS
jgi:integrase